jgi:hypothetical protein
MKKLLFFFLVISSGLFAQTGIGTTTPAASAKLEVYSTNKGFLPPRIALTGTADVSTIASPVAGLLIYNSATAGTAPNNVVPGYYYYNGTSWFAIANGVIIDNCKTAGFNLGATDNNKIFLITSASAVTITVPNTLIVGFSCQFIQGGAGQIVLSAGSGVTLNSANGYSTRATNSVIGLVMNTTTTGFVFGDSIF